MQSEAFVGLTARQRTAREAERQLWSCSIFGRNKMKLEKPKVLWEVRLCLHPEDSPAFLEGFGGGVQDNETAKGTASGASFPGYLSPATS